MSGMEKLEEDFFSRRSSVFFSAEKGFDFNIKLLKILWPCCQMSSQKKIDDFELIWICIWNYENKLWSLPMNMIFQFYLVPHQQYLLSLTSVNYLFLLCKIMRYHTVPYRQYLPIFIKHTAIPLISQN